MKVTRYLKNENTALICAVSSSAQGTEFPVIQQLLCKKRLLNRNSRGNRASCLSKVEINSSNA